MALADTIKDDWRIIDGIEDVTFTPQNPVGTARPNCKALRLPVSLALVGTSIDNLQIQAGDTVFDIWVSTMGTAPVPDPKRGDLIQQASGVRWMVIAARLETLSTRWYIICRKHQ